MGMRGKPRASSEVEASVTLSRAPHLSTRLIPLVHYNWSNISLSSRSQSETREFDDELMEREFDDELFGREYDSDLFEREPEPLFGFIRKWFGKKKT